MTKKIISIVLTATLVILLLPQITSAETYGDFEYSFYLYWDEPSDSYVEGVAICGYNGSSKEITIPSEINGYAVLAIEGIAFHDCTSLTEIIIPYGVISIEDGVFHGCTSLTTITIPDSVTSIGMDAFSNCTSLTEVTIPDGVMSIEDGVFYGCTSLTTITIPDSVTSIGDSAFCQCASLTAITIPDSVTSIGDSAFENCGSLGSGLEFIDISDNVIEIGNYAFAYCYFNKSGWESITEITIPASTVKIGRGAFKSCYLDSLKVDENNQNYLSENGILFNKDKTELVSYVYTSHYNENYEEEKSYTIPDGVTKIAEDAFEGSYLETITLPAGLNEIGDSAFENCWELSSVNIPESVTEIGDSAFEQCLKLSSVNIPQGITEIRDDVFFDCNSLTEITIPDGVTSIGDFAFEDCTSLTNITIYADDTEFGKYSLGYDYSKNTETGKYEYVPIDGFTITGIKGSTAEAYAEANGFEFIELVTAGIEDMMVSAVNVLSSGEIQDGDALTFSCTVRNVSENISSSDLQAGFYLNGKLVETVEADEMIEANGNVTLKTTEPVTTSFGLATVKVVLTDGEDLTDNQIKKTRFTVNG